MNKCHVLLFSMLVVLNACSVNTDPYIAYEQQNFTQAKELLEPMVAEDDPKAMTYLAAIHQIERDFARSEKLYTRAAKKNYASAQYNLGVLLHDGREIKRNIEQAYAWFFLASEQGDERAKGQLARMSSEITANQIIRAKKWALEQLDEG